MSNKDTSTKVSDFIVVQANVQHQGHDFMF